MIELLKQQEDQPASYPTVTGLSPKAEALDPAPIWQRIEAFIAYRWPKRVVRWIVSGRGEFMPPLADWEVTATEVAQVGVLGTPPWKTIELMRGPLGIELCGKRYRITAEVGSDDDPPPAVLAAFTRLAEYLAEGDARAISSYSRTLGDATTRVDRPMSWQARAIHYSGAADLLRPYRMA